MTNSEADNIITHFSLDLQVKEEGDINKTIDVVVNRLKALKRAGIEGADALQIVQRILSGSANMDPNKKSTAMMKGAEEFRKYEAEQERKERERQEREKRKNEREAYNRDRQARSRLSRIGGLVNPFAFISPKTGINVQQLLNNIARVAPGMMKFAFVFQSAKGVWDFASAVAELNTHIIQLGASSGMSTQKLVDLGAAVTAFGGSAEKVAQGNERFILQMERMKRGGGLGYLGDVAYKYGFSVDMNADWETNNKAAINYARSLDKTARMAFLKEWDPNNYTSNIMKANMSAGKVAANDAYYQSYDSLGDTQRATEATQEFNEETAKLQRAWTAITNQIAAELLPIMTAIVSAVRKFCDWLAKSRGIIVVVRTLIGAISGLMLGLLVKMAGRLAIERQITAQKTNQAALERQITAQKTVQAALTGPKGWASLAAAGLTIAGVAGGAIWGLSGLSSNREGGGGVSGDPLTSIKSTNSISLDELKNGTTLSASQSFALARSFERVRETADEVADKFYNVNRRVGQTSDALKSIAENAMTIQDLQRAAIVNANSSSVEYNANRNSNVAINTHIENHITGDAKDGIEQATQDSGQQIEESISQAAKRVT